MDQILTYRLVFILNFICCYSLMKSISWYASSKELKRKQKFVFIFSPYISVRSLWRTIRPASSSVFRLVIFSFLMSGFIILGRYFLGGLSYWDILLISPFIYFFTEAIGAFGQILFQFNPTFPIHRNPLFSQSLSEFWGRNWNLWVQDWLRDVSKLFTSISGTGKIALVFLISGLFHEAMVNLPYWIIYKKSYFGTMIGYFLIEAVALWIDKRYVKRFGSFWRRLYMWAAVILPSPLFINVPLLTFFGLLP